MIADRKFVQLQAPGTDNTTLLTADPGDYSQYNHDDTVDNQRFRHEPQDFEGTHVAHDLTPTPSSSHYRHQRHESLHVNFTPEDVKRIAGEIRDKTVADVHLSLFGYWIKESDENFKEAKKHLRELGVDRVSCLNPFHLYHSSFETDTSLRATTYLVSTTIV
jgi:ABC-type Zn2+ transport system substrate-binding protein/surface adhesin